MRRKTINNPIRSVILAVLLGICIVSQVLGYFAYESIPAIVWPMLNALTFVIPLAFGLLPGLLCLLPAIISEIIWTVNLGTAGPALHAITFLLFVVLCAIVYNITQGQSANRIYSIRIILFEFTLLAEEALYYFLRQLLVDMADNQMTWTNMSNTWCSLANPLMLIVLICLIRCGADEAHITGE